jgi:hypothetical protein
MWDSRSDVVKIHIDYAVHQVGQGRGRASIGHIPHLDLERGLHQFAEHLRSAATTHRGISDATRGFRGICNQLVQIGDRERSPDVHDKLVPGKQRDRLEIRNSVAQLAVEIWIAGQRRRGRHQEGVTVCRCAGDALGRDRSGTACDIFHYERLSRVALKPFSDRSCNDVHGAARRQRDHDCDRTGRIVLLGLDARIRDKAEH